MSTPNPPNPTYLTADEQIKRWLASRNAAAATPAPESEPVQSVYPYGTADEQIQRLLASRTPKT